MTSLKNKIVFITGASSGIGASCANAFAREGCKLILCARRKERLEDLAKKLEEQYQTEIKIFTLDVRDKQQVKNVYDELPSDWKNIDILINNAGLARELDKLQEGNPDDWDRMIDTNIKGLLYVTHVILPNMIKRNQGHIINIGSISGYDVYAGATVYCATKFAVKGLTKTLQQDLLGTQIRVSEIDPGVVKTEFSTVRFNDNKEKFDKVYKGMTPLSGDDVAQSVLFCASQPQHVNIAQIIVLPTDQRSGYQVYRTTK